VRYKKSNYVEGTVSVGRAGISLTFFLLGIVLLSERRSRGALVEVLFHRAIGGGGGSASRRVKNGADRPG